MRLQEMVDVLISRYPAKHALVKASGAFPTLGCTVSNVGNTHGAAWVKKNETRCHHSLQALCSMQAWPHTEISHFHARTILSPCTILKSPFHAHIACARNPGLPCTARHLQSARTAARPGQQV